MPRPSIARPPQLLTTSVIADRLSVSVKRIEYILRTRRHIQPAAYAGNIRLFDEGGVTLIEIELADMDAKRANGSRKGGGDAPSLF
jgi:hypothetical protein